MHHNILELDSAPWNYMIEVKEDKGKREWKREEQNKVKTEIKK